MSRSVMKIHHPTSVRSLVFSPTLSHPLQAVVGLDNGSIYRWDLQMGQRGQLDRLPVAHTGPILALDWCTTWVANKGADSVPTQMERSWIVSGGLDHTVKVCRFYILLKSCTTVRKGLGSPGIKHRVTYREQTDVYATSFISSQTCSLAA